MQNLSPLASKLTEIWDFGFFWKFGKKILTKMLITPKVLEVAQKFFFSEKRKKSSIFL